MAKKIKIRVGYCTASHAPNTVEEIEQFCADRLDGELEVSTASDLLRVLENAKLPMSFTKEQITHFIKSGKRDLLYVRGYASPETGPYNHFFVDSDDVLSNETVH